MVQEGIDPEDADQSNYNAFGNNQNFEGLFEPGIDETYPEQIEGPEPVEDNVQEDESGDKKEKYKLYHSVKLKPEEEAKFQQIMDALGTTNDSEVLKWCLKKAYSVDEAKIKRIAKKKRNIEKL